MLPAAQNAVSAGKNNWKPACVVGAWEPWNAAGALGALFLPCRMLEYMGSSCWRMPSNYLHGMSLVVVVFLVEELILYADLNVETNL